MRKNKRRMAAGLVALLLILLMILSLGAAVARGDEITDDGDGTAAASSAVSSVSAESTDAQEQTSPSSAGTEQAAAGQVQPEEKGGRIYIENIDITDLTKVQADAAIAAKMDELRNDRIVLYAGAQQAVTTAGALGLTYKNGLIVEEAMSIGKKGNIFKRFCAQRALQNYGDIVIDLDLSVPQATVLEVVREKEEELNCEPRACGLRLNEDRTFSVTPKRDGISIVEEASAIQITNYMNQVWHGGEGGVTLISKVTEASDSTEDLKKVTDILGTGMTSYTPSDDENRDTNIRLAVEHIDGTLLYPGEEFSASEVIGPQTAETGFKLGGTYSSGGVIQTYGGGVCQVTTTLYNAVLTAELEVTERHNHSFLVHYADPAFDAAIAEDSMDFRFVNNLNTPVYIEGTVDHEGTITFQIYGEETRDPNRRVVYTNSTGEWIDYETEFVTDSSLYFGYITATSGQEGLDAQLWKQIYYGDNDIPEEELVNISRYQPMDLTYRIGTYNASGETLAMINAAIATGDLYQVQMAVNNGSVITEEGQI